MTVVLEILEGIEMTNRLYIAGSLGDQQRAKRVIDRATKAGWTITRDWTQDPLEARSRDGERQGSFAEAWLMAVYECDVFIHLGTAFPSRGKERELGAALILKTMGYEKRIILSQCAGADALPASGTAWDELCEVYPDDEAALTALGVPGPVPVPMLAPAGPETRALCLDSAVVGRWPSKAPQLQRLSRAPAERVLNAEESAAYAFKTTQRDPRLHDKAILAIVCDAVRDHLEELITTRVFTGNLPKLLDLHAALPLADLREVAQQRIVELALCLALTDG